MVTDVTYAYGGDNFATYKNITSWYIPETNRMLCVNYTSVEKKKRDFAMGNTIQCIKLWCPTIDLEKNRHTFI